MKSKLLFPVASCPLLILVVGCSSNTNIPSQETKNNTLEYNLSNSQESKSSMKSSESRVKEVDNFNEDDFSIGYFTQTEIKELSKAFQHGSCDMTTFNHQTQKYYFSNTYGNPYVDGQEDINELSDNSKCLLIQHANTRYFSTNFFTDTKGYIRSDFNQVDSDSEIINKLAFDIDYSKFPSCNVSQRESPFTVVFLKDKSGNIERSIVKNEYEIFDCYEDALKNIRAVKNKPIKIDKKWQGLYEYSTYQTVESKGTSVGEDYTIEISNNSCHVEISGFQVYRQFDCYTINSEDNEIISIYQTDNKKEFGRIKYNKPQEYFINIKYYDKQTGVDNSFFALTKMK